MLRLNLVENCLKSFTDFNHAKYVIFKFIQILRYAGNAMATVQSTDPVKFVGVRTTSFPPLGESDSSAPIESVSGSMSGPSSEHMAFELSNTSGPSLTSASNVVSGGRGMGNGDNFKIPYDMSEKLPDCAVGASRAAVDAGFVGNDLQVLSKHF